MARLSLPRCRRFGGKSSRRLFAPGRGSYSCRRQLGCRSAAPGAKSPDPDRNNPCQPINRTRTNKMTQIQGYFDPRFETVRELFAQQQSDPQARGAALCVTVGDRSEEHTSELQSRPHLVCRLLLEKKKKKMKSNASK